MGEREVMSAWASSMIVVVSVFSVGLTAYLFWLNRRGVNSSTSEFLNRARQISFEPNTSSIDQLKLLAELAKIEATAIPWWERSVSTMGVISAAAMLVTIGWQTYQTAADSSKLLVAQRDVERLTREKVNLEEVARSISRAVSAQARAAGSVDPDTKVILQSRLRFLKDIESPTQPQIVEMVRLSLLLDELQASIVAFEQDPGLIKDLDPSDSIAIAEYLFIKNNPGESLRVLKSLAISYRQVSAGPRLRYLALLSLLGEKKEEFAKQVAQDLHLTNEAAIQRLESERRSLQDRKSASMRRR